MRGEEKYANDEVMYKIGGHAGIRLSKKSGTTQEIVNLLNKIHTNKGNISAEIIDAIKLKIDMEKHYSKTQIDELRKGRDSDPISIIEKSIKTNKASNVTEIKNLSKNREIVKVKQIQEENTFEGNKEMSKQNENAVNDMPGLKAFNSMKKFRK